MADPLAFGPADVAREIAAVVETTRRAGQRYDLVLLGNDAADSGDFQVGIRLAYALGWPVVNGVTTCRSPDGEVTASGDGPGRRGDLPGAAARGGDGPRGRRRAALPEPSRAG